MAMESRRASQSFHKLIKNNYEGVIYLIFLSAERYSKCMDSLPPHFTSDSIVHLPFWHVGTSEKAWGRCKVDKSNNQTENLKNSLNCS